MRYIKFLLLPLLLSLLTLSSNAQRKWSTGIRTGVEITNYQITTEDFRRDNYLWNKQVFVTKRLSQRFELELTLNHHQKEYYANSGSWGYLAGPDSFSSVTRQLVIQMGIAGKYTFFTRKHLSLYGSIGTTFAYINDKSAGVYYTQQTPTSYPEHVDKYNSPFHRAFFGAGINYLLLTNIYLNANMLVSYKLDGINHPGNSYYNRWTNGLMIGVGYRF